MTPTKTDHAARTASLALGAAKAASAAAQAAATIARTQGEMLARLDERQIASGEKFDAFVTDWRTHSAKIDDALDKIANHKHDEYISSNKFWGGIGTSIGTAVVTGLAAIGISMAARK